MPKKLLKIKWEYCECGCKGSSAKVKGIYFWHYWDIEYSKDLKRMRIGKFYLCGPGQGIWGLSLRKFKTLKSMNTFIRKYVKSNK